jgi:hypothetical protein
MQLQELAIAVLGPDIVKTDRKYAMIDLFGTPYTDKLHIVERYRLRDYTDVEDALERNTKENWLVGGVATAANRRKFRCMYIAHLPFIGFTHGSHIGSPLPRPEGQVGYRAGA